MSDSRRQRLPGPAEDHPEHLVSLMVSYQKGELEAFQGLYSALKSRLYQYLLSRTRDPSRAEDLLQETFLQLHRSRRTYQPGRPVLPWTLAIARHVYLANQRALGRRGKYERPAPEDLPEIPVPPQVSGMADQELIQKALNQLPEQKREAVLMHHVWGLTFEEIGALLGIRKGTAKLRAYRGMKMLHQLLR